MTMISDRVHQGRQSWNRELIETLGSSRVRYTVVKDAYEFQSYALAEVWRDGGWREIHRIPGPALQTKVSYVSRNVTAQAFAADITELRRVTAAILDVLL